MVSHLLHPSPCHLQEFLPHLPHPILRFQAVSCLNREDTGACDVQEAPAAIGIKSKPNLSPNCRLALAETRLPQPSVQQQRRPERSLVGGQGTRGRTHSQSPPARPGTAEPARSCSIPGAAELAAGNAQGSGGRNWGSGPPVQAAQEMPVLSSRGDKRGLGG